MVTEAVSPALTPDTSMSSAMALSSSPDAAAVSSVASSATPVTVTGSSAVWLAVSVPSVDVAVTVSVKSSALLAAGVMVRPSS
ncbi:hypothetical protein [Pacificispira sp.]|uniref:hypothetical protein n=1 Tax=Pacificispira sp. TaxID=2888761 RepID=UPI003B517FD3